jgi:hypothetical protein
MTPIMKIHTPHKQYIRDFYTREPHVRFKCEEEEKSITDRIGLKKIRALLKCTNYYVINLRDGIVLIANGDQPMLLDQGIEVLYNEHATVICQTYSDPHMDIKLFGTVIEMEAKYL